MQHLTRGRQNDGGLPDWQPKPLAGLLNPGFRAGRRVHRAAQQQARAPSRVDVDSTSTRWKRPRSGSRPVMSVLPRRRQAPGFSEERMEPLTGPAFVPEPGHRQAVWRIHLSCSWHAPSLCAGV